jgi:AraC-like DNA-binding protein/quercetin dioxygenase-like cupin family protein
MGLAKRTQRSVPTAFQQRLKTIDASDQPLLCVATDYEADTRIERHAHRKHQLVYAVTGVMVVQTEAGQWVVPPTRGIWMPAGTLHWIRCIGAVQMRSVFVKPGLARDLPDALQVVGISALLRELIKAAAAIAGPYASHSRDGRVMRLIVDELRTLPALPLHLPQPTDRRLREICDHLAKKPDDDATLSDWAERLSITSKTIQRAFVRETGMTFGQWRQQSRLLRALERLALGEKVVDIALELGYESPSAFATMFKRQFGRTPSQFFE